MVRKIIGLTHGIESLASRSKLFYLAASKYYRNVIENEALLADISMDDHILCIGGGICPFSAILFHQLTGAEVTVIDNCMECVSEAEQIINRMGLDKYVHAVYQDGGSIGFSLSKFSVIHFALQVFPMEFVFPRIKRQVLPGTKILVRRPKNCLNMMYSQFTGSLLTCCRHIAHQKACNIGRTLLYVKQERLNEEKMAEAVPVPADTSAAFSYPCAV